MYLKQIKIYGFKSFADKIDIDLCPNINGIVGPNGSGKSNVIDAVRWVLGEQSNKSLRAESATDVIFSGSKSRKALNSASVNLIFDNTDRVLPIDYNEVSVKRIMYRSGENEYFINNGKCRLKDITELLTDSGANRESFNIISQGKIDEILSSKPQDRRVVFESAAGVIKYKRRKEEAIRKLDKTNINLNRVKDIINELETNLEPLKIQSEKATEYLNVKNRLKEKEISLNTYDIENLTFKINENKEKLEKLNDEIIELSSNNSQYDITLLKDKEELKGIEENINSNNNNLIEITKEIENIGADIRVLKERKKYVKTSDKTKDNLLKLEEENLKINAELNNLNNIKIIESKKIEEKSIILKEKEKELDKKLEDNHKNENIINDINRSITDIKYQTDTLRNSINNNNSLPNSVKNIINNPRFNYVHGTISSVIETKEEYMTALSISLGASANYVIVDNSENAKELVKYLKENNLGRATFFPLNVIKKRYIEEDILNSISKIEGYINTLDNLVTYDQKYENIIKNQMGNVLICNTIDTANKISKIIKEKYKIVTLDGQIVNVGGSITGGSILKQKNIITEKYELERKEKELESNKSKKEEIETIIKNNNTEINSLKQIIYTLKEEIREIESNYQKYDREYIEQNNNLAKISNEIKDLKIITNDKEDDEESKLLNKYYQSKEKKDNILTIINSLKVEKESLEKSIEEIESTSKKSNSIINNKEKQVKELEISLNESNIKIDNLLLSLNENYNMTFEYAKERYKLEENVEETRHLVTNLKYELKNLGEVNIGAIEEYKRLKERYDFLNNQKNDLENAEDTLIEIINEMDDIMKEKFLTTFERIKVEFKKVFKEMFKGGNAELSLTDPDNLLETGIEIMAIPSGKTLKSISLLSGGEKTFTAISLLFAILNIKPVPFCLLDEVEAALDDANVDSFGNYLSLYRDKTQFILITHKKKTMEFVDTLYGITMQESGVSKLVSVKLEDIKR